MKEDKTEKLYDEYLKAVQGMRPAETKPFFYARVIAGLERKNEYSYATFFKPSLIALSLAILLILNVWVVFNNRTRNENDSLKQVASEYNLTVQSTY